MISKFIPKISPSLLAANFAKLGEETQAVLQAGADWIHIDVMDNHFVPNLSLGPQICQALRAMGIDAPLDVHLMIQPVDTMIERFAKAGATMITFHPEASDNIAKTIKLIQKQGCQVGLSLKPSTPISVLEKYIDQLDLILIMSVEPGFAGQAFIPATLARIAEVKKLIAERDIELVVDGGVNQQNAQDIIAAGATVLVAGNAVFKTDDYVRAIRELKG